MFEHLTDRARKVMALSNQAAQRLGSSTIEPEHLLCGMLVEGSGVGSSALRELGKDRGFDLRTLRTEIDKTIKIAAPEADGTQRLPQSKETKKIVEDAINQSRALHHNYIGTEHLLLAILSINGTAAQSILFDKGLNAKIAKEKILEIIGEYAPPVEAEPLSAATLPKKEVEPDEVVRFRSMRHQPFTLGDRGAVLTRSITDYLGEALQASIENGRLNVNALRTLLKRAEYDSRIVDSNGVAVEGATTPDQGQFTVVTLSPMNLHGNGFRIVLNKLLEDARTRALIVEIRGAEDLEVDPNNIVSVLKMCAVEHWNRSDTLAVVGITPDSAFADLLSTFDVDRIVIRPTLAEGIKALSE